MAKDVFLFKDGRLIRPPTGEIPTILQRELVELPDLQGVKLTEGELPDHVKIRLMAAQKEKWKPLVAAARMKRDHPAEFQTMTSFLEHQPDRAELILRVAEQNMGLVEDAAMVMCEPNLDPEKVGRLLDALRKHTQIQDLTGQLYGLERRPEPPPAQNPKKKVVVQVPVTVIETPTPQPEPPPAPAPAPTVDPEAEALKQADAAVLERLIGLEQTIHDLPGDYLARCETAYDGFKEQGGMPAAVNWEAVFASLAGPPRRRFTAEQSVRYFENMMAHPDGIAAYTDDNRLRRGGTVMNWAIGLARANGVSDISEDAIFGGVFLREPALFELTTSVEASRIQTDGDFEDAVRGLDGRYRSQYVRLLALHPETLHNIASDPRKNAVPEYLSRVLMLPDGMEHLRRFFESAEQEGLSLGLTDRRRLNRGLDLVSEWGMVNPAHILSGEFINMDDGRQQAELERLRRFAEDPAYVEPAAQAPPENGQEGAEDKQPGKKPAQRRQRRIPPTVPVHGLLVPNPQALGAAQAAQIDNRFSITDWTFIRPTMFGDIRSLPIQQQQIVAFLSHAESTTVGELLETLCTRNLVLGRVYTHDRDLLQSPDAFQTQGRLYRDLNDLSQRGLIDVQTGETPSATEVRLSGKTLRVGKPTDLTDQQREVSLNELYNQLRPNGQDLIIDRAIVGALTGFTPHQGEAAPASEWEPESFLAKRHYLVAAVTAMVPNTDAAKVSRRLSSLTESGLLLHADAKGESLMLSPRAIKRTTYMNIPPRYETDYRHAVDPVVRLLGMYQPSIRTDAPLDRSFHPSVAAKETDVYRALALILSKGKIEAATKSDAIAADIELGERIVKVLSNVDVNLVHGAKREDIVHTTGLSEGKLQALLADLVATNMLERVALGYYRVSKRYGEAAFDEGKAAGDLQGSGVIKTQTSRENALSLMKTLWGQAKTNPKAMRMVDLVDVLRMLGPPDEDLPEDRVAGVTKALTEEIPDTVRMLGSGPGRREETRPGCKPLVQRFHPADSSEVFWQLNRVYWA